MRNLSKLMRLFNIALMNTLYNISNKVTQSTHINTCVYPAETFQFKKRQVHVKINLYSLDVENKGEIKPGIDTVPSTFPFLRYINRDELVIDIE